MTIEEIQTALGELVAAMVEKGVPTPKAEFTIKQRGEKFSVYLKTHDYKFKEFDGKNYHFFHHEDVAVCIDKAREYIAALPSPEEVVQWYFC